MIGTCSLCTCRLYSTDFKKKPSKYKKHNDSNSSTNSHISTPKTVTKACSVCQVNLPLNGSVCESCSLNGTLCQAVQQLRPCLPHDPGVRTRSRRPKCRRIRLPQSDFEISGVQQQPDNIQRRVQAVPLLWTQEVEACSIQAGQRSHVPVHGGAVAERIHEVQKCSGSVLPHRIQHQWQATRILGERKLGEESASASQMSRLYQDEREVQHRRTSQEAFVLGGQEARSEQREETQAPRVKEERSTSQAQPSLDNKRKRQLDRANSLIYKRQSTSVGSCDLISEQVETVSHSNHLLLPTLEHQYFINIRNQKIKGTMLNDVFKPNYAPKSNDLRTKWNDFTFGPDLKSKMEITSDNSTILTLSTIITPTIQIKLNLTHHEQKNRPSMSISRIAMLQGLLSAIYSNKSNILYNKQGKMSVTTSQFLN